MPVKNTCDCHNPPGGRVVCEPDQMAICIVLNGHPWQECRNPPSIEGTAAVVLVNWALTEVIGSYRANDASIDGSELQMLLAGTFERDSGEMVTFALPEGIRSAVRTLVQRFQARRIAEAY